VSKQYNCKSIVKSLRASCGILVVVLFVTSMACDTPYAGAISDFGTAAATVVQQTRAAYILVNNTVLQEEILSLAAKPGPLNSDPARAFPPFVTPEDLDIRNALLDALQAYATALGNLTGKTASDLDSETTQLAASLTELSKNDRLEHSFREVKSVSKEETNAAAAGVDAIGKFLVEKRISADLPAMLKKNQPHIEALATLLIHEIGDVPTAAEPGRLRGKLWRTYDSLLQAQVTAVNASAAGSNEKQQSVAKLADLVTAQRNADAALGGTQSALKKLLAAHRALIQVQTAPASFKTEVAALVAQARQAQDYYAKLPTK
jgi:hypothetical protein